MWSLNCLVDKVNPPYLLCETRNKQKNSYFLWFLICLDAGKSFNSICYRLPIEVDFIRAFNIKVFYNIFLVIFKYFCQFRFCCDYVIIFNKDYFFILENFISKVRLYSFSEMFVVCNFFHVEVIIEIFSDLLGSLTQ